MRRCLAILAACTLASFAVGAFSLNVELGIGGAAMTYVNGLIGEHEALTHEGLRDLGPALTGRIGAVLNPITSGIRPEIGLELATTSVRARDTTVNAAIVGGYAGLAYSIGGGHVSAAIDGYRGSFSFPAARYVDLAGWGVGVHGGVGYGIQLAGERLVLRLSLVAQWMPVWNLSDTEGLEYRGRGQPFLDFSGIGVSLGVEWRN